MKALIHSNAPWETSGYGKMAAHIGRMLLELGHEVSFSAFSGLGGTPITWHVPGIEGRRGVCAVYPHGQLSYSPDVLAGHAHVSAADVIITLMDQARLMPAAAQLRALKIPLVVLAVIDAVTDKGGIPVPDEQFIRASGALPVAISAFGHEALMNSDLAPKGWEIPFVPHTVDTAIFKPHPDREQLRIGQETADQFVIGICGANRDMARKGYAEQFEAFARFSKRHSEARLSVFSVADSVNGIPLIEIAGDMGILDKTEFMPTYEQVSGLLAEEFMATWYNSIDLLSACSYAEGFCLPVLEAQACRTPVVATDCSALTELVKSSGWLARGHRYWNFVHRAWWVRPDVDQIVYAWEDAYTDLGDVSRETSRRQLAAAAAAPYRLDVVRERWRFLMRDVADWIGEHKGTVEYDGLRWRLDDPSQQFGDVLALGHESVFTDQILGQLGDGSVFVDVGAHVGHWAVRAAAKGARVIAIEADPVTCERLKANAALNDLPIEPYNAAAWDDFATLKIRRQHGYACDGTNSVMPDGKGEEGQELIAAIPLDEILAGEDRVDLIKIDTEGADLHVLRGLRKTLERLRPPMFIEDHSVHGMYERAELDALLTDLGYTWRDLPHGYLMATAAVLP